MPQSQARWDGRLVGCWIGRPPKAAHAAGEFGRLPRSRLTGTTASRRPRSVTRWGRAFGACCFASKLRSPGGPGPAPPWPRPWTPTLVGTLVPTRVPTPATRVPPHRLAAGSPPVMPPSGEWSERSQGALRAIDSFRRSRSWRTFGRPACGGNQTPTASLLSVVIRSGRSQSQREVRWPTGGGGGAYRVGVGWLGALPRLGRPAVMSASQARNHPQQMRTLAWA